RQEAARPQGCSEQGAHGGLPQGQVEGHGQGSGEPESGPHAGPPRGLQDRSQLGHDAGPVARLGAPGDRLHGDRDERDRETALSGGRLPPRPGSTGLEALGAQASDGAELLRRLPHDGPPRASRPDANRRVRPGDLPSCRGASFAEGEPVRELDHARHLSGSDQLPQQDQGGADRCQGSEGDQGQGRDDTGRRGPGGARGAGCAGPSVSHPQGPSAPHRVDLPGLPVLGHVPRPPEHDVLEATPDGTAGQEGVDSGCGQEPASHVASGQEPPHQPQRHSALATGPGGEPPGDHGVHARSEGSAGDDREETSADDREVQRAHGLAQEQHGRRLQRQQR
ncbi:unnamed protein product, partial [Prorocentrum cordatum]